MYYLEDTCILCLKNNVELKSVFIQDNDGIVFSEKLRCCFPEIFDSTPDTHKLACLECFEKLHFLYESKQSVICNITLMRNYLDKLQCENKTFQQPSVVLSARKRRKKDSNTRNLPEVKVENVGNSFKIKIKNFNLNSTNDEQLNKIDHSCQPTANENVELLTKYKCLTEDKDLETKNVEKVVPVTETRTICVKQEPQFSNLNLNSTNDEQLNTVGHSCQPTANENVAFLTEYNCLNDEKNLETINMEKVVPVTETRTICVKQEPQFTNLNLNSTNDEQLNTVGHSYQPTANENVALLTEYNCLNEEKNLITKNMEKVVPVTETRTICVKQEPQFSNLNLNSTNDEQLNTVGHSYQPTANENVALLKKYNCLTEEIDLDTKNVEKVVPVTETGTICVKQEPQFSNYNISSANEEQLNTIDHSSQPTENKNGAFSILYNCLTVEKNLQTKNVEQVLPVAETETIYIKQEPQFSDDDSTTGYLDKEVEESEGCSYRNEDDPNFEMSEEGTSRPNDHNNQKVNAILNSLKPLYVSDDSTKFCNTCQELLFKDLVNINVHLYTHIQSSNCSRCEDSLEEINKFQRHMFNHCETIFEILDKGDHGEKFSCALCDQQFDEFSNLKKHIPDEHIRSLKCVVCFRTFTHKPNLLRHILVTHCNVKLYKCKICPTRFTCKEAIKEHVFYQHYNGKVCVCKHCYQTFRNPKTLREHISKHHEEVLRLEEEKLLTYDSAKNSDAVELLSCAVCHQKFNEVDNLKNHIYDYHVNRAECEICYKIFQRRNTAVRHILETHCRVKLYNCIICAKKFTCKKNYDNHIIQMHNNGNIAVTEINKVTVTENFSCGICGEQFDDFEIFKKHIYENHMPGLKCVKCPASYTRRITLHRHIMEKHCDVNFLKCVICSAQFKTKEGFKNHMIYKHNGGKTITEPDDKGVPIRLVNGEKFTCKVCTQQFDVLENLRRHIYDEHITDLNCVVCSNTYCSRVDLNRHILKIHCDLRFFKCVICSVKFISKDSFKNHMIHQHNDGKTITELENKVQPVNGQKFTCTICHNQFEVFESLKRHIYDVHITGVDCVVCSKTYCSRPDLNRHILKIHCDMRLFKCVICSLQFTGKESFKNHMINHHNDGKTITEPESKIIPVTLKKGKTMTCTVCTQQFDVFETFKRHIYDEHMPNLYCVVCYKSSTCRTDLNRHILEQHCHIKIFKCKFCPHRFVCKESFKDHMSQQHSSDGEQEVIGAVTELENNVGLVMKPEEVFIKEEPYYSDEYYSSDEEYEADNYETGKDFSNFAMAEESNSCSSNPYDLKEAIGSSVIPNTTATTETSYCEPGAPVDQSDVCEICRKMFLYLSNLSEHLKAHMQESSCSMCKDSADNISRLQRHMLTPCGNTNTPPDSANTANTRTNDKVTCVICQQKFKFVILKKHMHTHITNLACVVCNRTFTMKQNLLRHLVHHCELKPLQCEVCGKSFSVKSGLKYHVENAHSVEVIACQYCKTEFKNFRSLQKHVLDYHPNYKHTCEVCKRNFPFKNELEKHAKLCTFSQ